MGSTGFDEEEKKSSAGRGEDKYLSSIRAQMAHQAAVNSQESAKLNFGGQSVGSALEVQDAPDGVHVILHADKLFEENSSALRPGATEIFDRVTSLFERADKEALHFTIADAVMDGAEGKELDAERSQFILAALEFSAHRESND